MPTGAFHSHGIFLSQWTSSGLACLTFSILEVSLLSVNNSSLPSMDFLIIIGAGEEKMMTFLTD